jgi:hypothetical protein
MTFPLYQDLFKNSTETDLTDDQKDELIKKIKKMDLEGHELIYALIRCFQLENETNYELPYEGKSLKLGYKFDLEKFPKKLRQIVYKFSEKHLEKMKEDQKINKNRK